MLLVCRWWCGCAWLPPWACPLLMVVMAAVCCVCWCRGSSIHRGAPIDWRCLALVFPPFTSPLPLSWPAVTRRRLWRSACSCRFCSHRGWLAVAVLSSDGRRPPVWCGVVWFDGEERSATIESTISNPSKARWRSRPAATATATRGKLEAPRQAGQKCDVRRRRRYLAPLLSLCPSWLPAVRRRSSCVGRATPPARAADPEASPRARAEATRACRLQRGAQRWRGSSQVRLARSHATPAAWCAAGPFCTHSNGPPQQPTRCLGRDRRRRAACDRSRRLVVLFALGMKSRPQSCVCVAARMPLQKRAAAAGRPRASLLVGSRQASQRTLEEAEAWTAQEP